MEDVQPYLDSVFRWIHVLAGITWIGLLYFFNWVNSAFAPTLDADSKKKVVPELLPRTLYWFRWGAAFTWISGVILIALVYYHGRAMWDGVESQWGLMPALMVAITLLGVFVYDALVKTALKDPKATFLGGWILASALVIWYQEMPHISWRGAVIHLGAMFGTFMAFNVWYRIWPAQQKIINAVKNGTAPDADLVKLAGTRSKHNTYMSFPLVFAMLNQHMVWAAGKVWVLPVVILVGWLACYACYQKAKQVPGF